MDLTGIHHLTAISARVVENHRFYTQTLGMRLVKRSVNQDDVSAYHLFYADALASPGSDLTFFDWPVPRERRGTRAITRTHLRVAGREALEWWAEHLHERGVAAAEIAERDGRLTLDFEDAEGQRLSLVDDQGAGEAHPWERSPVPAGYQVRGLRPILLSVPSLQPTALLLQKALMGRGSRSTRTQPRSARKSRCRRSWSPAAPRSWRTCGRWRTRPDRPNPNSGRIFCIYRRRSTRPDDVLKDACEGLP